jgi:hypothetical protein
MLPGLLVKSPQDLLEDRMDVLANGRRTGVEKIRVATAFRDSLESEVGVHPVVKKINEEGIICKGPEGDSIAQHPRQENQEKAEAHSKTIS